MIYELKSIPLDETLRYALGSSAKAIPDELAAKAKAAVQEILSCCQPKYHYIIKPVNELVGSLLIGEDIRRHLDLCENCVLLCATLGAQVDSLIRREQVCDMTKALFLDAAASAAIEEVCDNIQLMLAEQQNRSLTRRFSCGYGDLPLEIQKDFLSFLDAGRMIGLSASHSGMLIPIKSVTAVIGILPDGVKPNDGKPCAVCRIREGCVLRRKGVYCGKYSC